MWMSVKCIILELYTTFSIRPYYCLRVQSIYLQFCYLQEIHIHTKWIQYTFYKTFAQKSNTIPSFCLVIISYKYLKSVLFTYTNMNKRFYWQKFIIFYTKS